MSQQYQKPRVGGTITKAAAEKQQRKLPLCPRVLWLCMKFPTVQKIACTEDSAWLLAVQMGCSTSNFSEITPDWNKGILCLSSKILESRDYLIHRRGSKVLFARSANQPGPSTSTCGPSSLSQQVDKANPRIKTYCDAERRKSPALRQ